MSEDKYLKILPRTCPSCGEPMWFDQNTGKAYCRNPDCPSKKKHKSSRKRLMEIFNLHSNRKCLEEAWLLHSEQPICIIQA